MVVVLLLVFPLLLANESLGRIGVFSLHAGLHVLQLPLLGSQNISVLGTVLTQRHLSRGVDLMVRLLLWLLFGSNLTFSTPRLSAARNTSVLVAHR